MITACLPILEFRFLFCWSFFVLPQGNRFQECTLCDLGQCYLSTDLYKTHTHIHTLCYILKVKLLLGDSLIVVVTDGKGIVFVP